ncbi:hypothetical protein [Candidatus Uabimicrobium amorphum]|uniref:Uncharacterized protein n=1 Tax=Uabimicrobium amorphum TaxID=2596890 RepID=A0A5S9INI7_UABAM|nr:hypothetical protein [Candidatus Uabimicrobium amorphum]BBM84797.1 hypothetical protein UABAM_03158 [Candidatus Uabimicrobium amorphum]
MKWLLVTWILMVVVCAELIEEQLQINEQKANVLHKEFMKDFQNERDTEFSSWLGGANQDQQKKLQEIFTVTTSRLQNIQEQLKTKRKKLLLTESKKITDAFGEIKKQGTPEKMLERRAVAMGHTLFHALQKIYKEERERITNIYWGSIRDAMEVLGKENSEIDTNIDTRTVKFKLEESIKTRTHNLTHTFQVLNEYEFNDNEKTWVLGILTEQIKREEIERSQRKQRLNKLEKQYLAKKRAEYQTKREELDEEETVAKAYVDKDVANLKSEIAIRRASYERNLAMYTQRRVANLQREVYYFKGFIDAEIGRYKKSNFPQSVIDILRKNHWDVFLELTKSNFQRWLVEDRIIFVRFLVKELSQYGYSAKESEEYLLKIVK